MARAAANSALRRFESAKVEPDRVVALQPDHPAVIQGRTIFPGSVVGSAESPRFLVSGHNNTKLGAEVTKGERAGWPIYHVTLEERATCPRSCANWLGCYGNGMPYARRHSVDGAFMDALRAEVLTVARQHRGGLLVRLHTLGDFFSVEYVLMWGELLALLPQLHVFGYTARHEDDPDPASRRIAKAIRLLTQGAWSRFAIRTSHTEQGPERAIVVGSADPDRPKVIVCPAQTHATETCGTCGLCWAGGARDKTIAFLRHGMKRATGPRAPKVAERLIAQPALSPPFAASAPPPTARMGLITGTGTRQAQMAAAEAWLRSVADAAGEVRGISLSTIAREANIPLGSALFILRDLEVEGVLTITKGGKGANKVPPKNVYRLVQHRAAPPAVAPAPFTPPKPEAVPIAKPVKALPRVPDTMSVNQPIRPRIAAPAPAAPPVATKLPPALPGVALGALEIEPIHEGPSVLTKLGVGQCHWPLEHSPTGVDQLYCGKPCSRDEQYCKSHRLVMYAAPRKSQAQRGAHRNV